MSVPLANQDRHRSLADLEAAIAEAERSAARYRDELDRLPSAEAAKRRTEAMLRLAEERVARLRAGRDVLAHGDLGASGDDQVEE